ncbi:MAG: MarR family winged helix-turn-helix transcriptional regulator [Dehalococcoidia bacterium]
MNPIEGDSEPVGQRVAVGLMKIGLALRHRAWLEAGPRGITPTQGQILAMLQRHPEGLSLSTIAGQLAVTAPTASDAVRVLSEKGLVRKSPAATDRRAIRVTLTDSGQIEAEQTADWPEFLAEAAETLSEQEQAVFLRALVKMIRTLQERGEIPIARMCAGCHYFRPNVHADPVRPHHCAFVDAPFGDRSLRLDCPDFDAAPPAVQEEIWKAFVGAAPAGPASP